MATAVPTGGQGLGDGRAARVLEVRGIVQGVGFRPFVWRLAERHGLSGWVRNAGGTVEIRAEGPPDALEAFCAALSSEAPPLAEVGAVRSRPVEPEGFERFEVDESREDEQGERLVSPDVATCPACLRELFDPADRRYRFPFINCTDCGPRFTIIESLPYDRERTSMRAFPMCADCAREYRDPADRRFHAEPVACPACGPRLRLLNADGSAGGGDPIEGAAALLADGGIVAVKGLGGFHLACDASDDAAVLRLRRRKMRPEKPLAVMVRDLTAARELFALTAADEKFLASWSAPIVLVGDRGRLAPSVAPGHRRHGAMLPSTPLHHLLLREVDGPRVMTSGNLTDEPICTTNAEAMARLGGVADAFLVHDRDIVARYDDSVVMAPGGRRRVLRRARSIAPTPIGLPASVAPVLGCGAELHGTFCLAAGDRAFVSQHIGDLDTGEATAAYEDALSRFRALFGIDPVAVGHDLHPDFASTRLAERTGLPSVGVQHHHAHVAAVMAEHRLDGRVIGVAFDGFGLGDDGTAWGGEFLECDWGTARRAGHLRAVRLPGGDAAVRNPVRMAIAHAADAGVLDRARGLLNADEQTVRVVLGQIESGIGSPLTSSAGRLFDTVSALAGVCRATTYDGQPAMLLEQTADLSATKEYPVDMSGHDGRVVVDTRPIIEGVVWDLASGRSPAEVAGRFHRTLAAATLEVCRMIRDATGLSRVCLAGGVFQNVILTADLVARLGSSGFDVFVPHEVPVGDGGVSLGQVLVAHARLGG